MTALDIALNAKELGAAEQGGRLGRIKSRLGRVRTSRTERIVQDALAIAVQSGGRQFKSTLIANAIANLVRNVWSHSIIFCGHFPDQTYTFSQKETEDESRGAWYVRQLTGAANIEGGPMFHIASGNLGYQVEHHLYPDMPSTRYAEIAPRVKDICLRYGLPYNTGPLQPAAVHGPPHDRPAGLPRRQAAAQARPLAGRRHRGAAVLQRPRQLERQLGPRRLGPRADRGGREVLDALRRQGLRGGRLGLAQVEAHALAAPVCA